MHQAGVAGGQMPPVKPETLHHAGPEGFQQDIRLPHQPLEDPTVRGGLQIEPHHRFSGIDLLIEGGNPVLVGKDEPPHRIPGRRLDFDNVRPHIGKNLGCKRTGKILAQIKNPYPV